MIRPRVLLIVAMLMIAAGYQPPIQVRSEEPMQEDESIVVPQCRIKLIDQVELASDRAGVLAEVVAKEGSYVQKGDMVAKLRDETAVAAFRVAEHAAENDIQVRFAKKSADVARVEYDKARLTNQKSTRAVPEVELLRLKLAAERSILQIEQAEHEFRSSQLSRDEAQAQLSTYRIESPFDGFVTEVRKSAGEAVNQGDPILEIVNPNRLRIEGRVHVRDIAKVKPGAYVQVRLDVPGVEIGDAQEFLEGKIVFVDVSAQPVTFMVLVWAEVVNRGSTFRPGLTAEMTIDPTKDGSKVAASGQ